MQCFFYLLGFQNRFLSVKRHIVVEYFENMDGSEKGSDHGNEGHKRTYPEGSIRISSIFLVLNAMF